MAKAGDPAQDRDGGSISFDTPPGAGTTFTVRLPVGPADRAPDPADPSRSRENPFHA